MQNKEKVTQKNIADASKTLIKLSKDVECASNTLHKVLKRGSSIAQPLPLVSQKIEKLRKTQDTVGVVTNIAKFFKQGHEEKFYSEAIPLILEQSGFDKSTRVHKIATSNLAGKTASFLKPAALSVLSYYVRKHEKLIPENNPLQLEDYPSLLDMNTSSSERDRYSIYKKSSESQDKYCITSRRVLTECLDMSEKHCDERVSKLTEPIENRFVTCLNNKSQKHIISNQEYENLRNVLLSKGGVTKLYKNIFPKQSKNSKHKVEDLESSRDLQQYVESRFKQQSRFNITRGVKTHSF